MDKQTSQFYSENSAELAEKYDSCAEGGISDYFQKAFEPGMKILDIGCGSGRDLKILHEMGYQADGVDSCEEFVKQINTEPQHNSTTALPHHRITAFTDSLPELKTILDKSYDGILCSAVLMHLPEEQLFDASFAIRRILKGHGRVLLSIPLHDETIDPKTKRDPDNRLFNGIVPEKLQLLFERIGFRMLQRWDSPDSLGREHRKWATMLFELESATGTRPIDTIESILNKDAKVATYKLALFRAFANIATTNYKLAQWTNDGRVKISTQALAEKWIEYYWPLVEANIKQTTGDAIAFRKQLKELVDYFRSRGGLSAFVLQYRNNKLSHESTKICKTLMSKLKGTIWKQPVKYAGGGEDFSVLQYDRSDQTVLIGNDIWKELSLMGSWIQDATVLRWAELTAKITKDEIKASSVIDCLLTVPIQERDVNAAKTFYDSLPDKQCVWSGESIKNKYELDHAIPFSLWKNNDLWNLLPADAKENGSKKDKLPKNRIIKKRRDCIVNYWTLINNEFPARFEYEAAKLIGLQEFDKKNWKNRLFASFAEAVEITAIQRGVERWEPANFAATGTESGIRYAQSDTVGHNLIMDAHMEYNSKVARIAKIVSGGQTGADRGGLDAAIELGIPHGGWCPKGRLAEDGIIPDKYNQQEMTNKNYLKRTEKNVIDSTATVIFTKIPPKGGSLRTAEFAQGKPCLIVNTEMSKSANVAEIVEWLKNLRIPHRASPVHLIPASPAHLIPASSVNMGACTLNVAGSRGSKAPGLQEWVKEVMVAVISEINGLKRPQTVPEMAIIELDFYPNLKLACGVFKNEINDYEAEKMEIANPHNNLDPERHFVVRASGDSMDGGRSPIKDGNLLLLELNKGGTISNQIFAVEYQDDPEDTSYALKRIEKLPDGSYQLVSTNKKYPPIPVDPENMFPFARFKERVELNRLRRDFYSLEKTQKSQKG